MHRSNQTSDLILLIHLDMFRLRSEKSHVVDGDVWCLHLHWLFFSPSQFRSSPYICEVHTTGYAMDLGPTEKHATWWKCQCCMAYFYQFYSCKHPYILFLLFSMPFSTNTTARLWMHRKNTTLELQCSTKRNYPTWQFNHCAFMALR